MYVKVVIKFQSYHDLPLVSECLNVCYKILLGTLLNSCRLHLFSLYDKLFLVHTILKCVHVAIVVMLFDTVYVKFF